MDKNNIRKIKAFTLAEVLITLAIIGVVAAITIPSVIIDHQKTETAVRLKKAYSMLSRALAMSIKDNGPVLFWDFPLADENKFDPSIEKNAEFIHKYFTRYLGVNGTYKQMIYDLVGKNAFTEVYWIRLNDGQSIAFRSNSVASCPYFWIFVDVNGKKEPNRLGKDIFHFYLYGYGQEIQKANFIKPMGSAYTDDRSTLIHGRDHNAYLFACSKDEDVAEKLYLGSQCAALIQFDGWQIKDDYPW